MGSLVVSGNSESLPGTQMLDQCFEPETFQQIADVLHIWLVVNLS